MHYNKNNFAIHTLALKGKSKTLARPEVAGLLMAPTHTVATDTYILAEVAACKVPNEPETSARSPERAEGQSIIATPDAVKAITQFEFDAVAVERVVDEGVSPAAEIMIKLNGEDGEEVKIPRSIGGVRGTYPEYEHIFAEDAKPDARVVVNVNFLKKLTSILAGMKLQGDKVEIVVHNNSKKKMIVVRAETQAGQKVRAALAPINE